MAIGFAPVHQTSAEGVVHFAIDFTQRQTSKRDSCCFDPRKYGVEFPWADSEAVVLLGYCIRPLVKVNGESIVDEHG